MKPYLCAVIAFCGALADAIKDVRAKRFIAAPQRETA
jgi:hypothetical protein